MPTPTAGRLMIDHNRTNGIAVADCRRTIPVQNITLRSTGDVDTDLATIDMPSKYILRAVTVVARSLTGTAAASVFSLRTAAAGGGSDLITPGANTGLSANNGLHANTVPTQTAQQTASTLYFRQTTDSANAGTVDLYIEITDCTDRLPLV